MNILLLASCSDEPLKKIINELLIDNNLTLLLSDNKKEFIPDEAVSIIHHKHKNFKFMALLKIWGLIIKRKFNAIVLPVNNHDYKNYDSILLFLSLFSIEIEIVNGTPHIQDYIIIDKFIGRQKLLTYLIKNIFNTIFYMVLRINYVFKKD